MSPDVLVRPVAETAAASSRLICLPHAGGQSLTYLSFAPLLPRRTALLVAQRTRRRSQFDAVVARLRDALDALPPLPTVLLGHSMGASLAYELAHVLSSTPAALILSGAAAPTARQGHALRSDDAHLIETVVKAGLVSRTLLDSPEMLASFAADYRRDLSVMETYTPRSRPPLPMPSLVLGGAQDRSVPTDALRTWGGLFTRPSEVHLLEGRHDFLFRNPRAIQLVSRWLRRVLASRTP